MCHRIYIDCFCACDLSDSILIVAVFQNQYWLFLSITEFILIVSVDYFWASQNLYWLFLCVREICGWLQWVTLLRERTGDGNKSIGWLPFRINIDCFCVSQNLYCLFLCDLFFRTNIDCGCLSELFFRINIDYFWVSQNLYWLFLSMRERCGWLQRVTGSREVRSGPVRSGPVRSGLVRSGPVRSGPDRIQNQYWLFLCITEFILIVSAPATFQIHYWL